MRRFVKNIYSCPQCPNFRSDRNDPNPDVGMGRGEWCNAVTPEYWSGYTGPRGPGKSLHNSGQIIPNWCPLPELEAPRLRNEGLL